MVNFTLGAIPSSFFLIHYFIGFFSLVKLPSFKRLSVCCSVLFVEIITLGLWVFLVIVIVNYDLLVNRNAYAKLKFETYLFRIGCSTRFDHNDRFFWLPSLEINRVVDVSFLSALG